MLGPGPELKFLKDTLSWGLTPALKIPRQRGGDFLLVLVYGLELVVEADADDVVRAAVGVAT